MSTCFHTLHIIYLQITYSHHITIHETHNQQGSLKQAYYKNPSKCMLSILKLLHKNHHFTSEVDILEKILSNLIVSGATSMASRVCLRVKVLTQIFESIENSLSCIRSCERAGIWFVLGDFLSTANFFCSSSICVSGMKLLPQLQ